MSTFRSVFLLLLFVGAPVLLGGLTMGGCSCSHTPDDPCRIDISSGGGVTGIWTGYTIASDGTVSYWVHSPGRREREETAPLGRISDADLLALCSAVTTSEDSLTPPRAGGDFFTTLDVRHESGSVRVTWPGTWTDSSSWPSSLSSFSTRLLNALRSFEDSARTAPRTNRSSSFH